MNAVHLLSHLRSHNIRLWAENDQLRYSAPKGGMTDDLLAEIRKHKDELLNLAKNTEGFREAVPLSPVERTDTLPLSFAQQRLWFLDQLESNSPLYNIPRAVRIAGPLNIDALQSSLDTIVVRHEALRTSFALADGNPVQVIAEHRSVELPVIDLGELPAVDRRAEVERLCAQEARRPFDLSSDLMMRARLYCLDKQEHVLLLVIHHIAADGWSMGVLFRELSILYEAFAAGKPCPLAELAIQYADFAVWQRQWLQGEVLETQLGYWKKQLENAPPVLELPTDHPRPSAQTYRGARKSFSLAQPLVQRLKALSHNEGATLYMTLLAAFKVLLHRYTAKDDIIVGSAIANRNRMEVEGLIGFFVNTLVMRTDISGNVSFRELLARVRKVAMEAYAHQDIPFEKLVEELQPERNLSHSPIFQIIFLLQNAPGYAPHFSGLTLSPMDVDVRTSKTDLTLDLVETTEGIKGLIEYSSDLFSSATITRMIGHYQTLLESIISHPDQLISKLALLTGPEQHQLLVDWNDTRKDYPKDNCIQELFESQVKQTPDSIAVVFGEEALTYRELNRRANQLAHHLQKLGVGPDVLVGIYVQRSLEMMVAVWGVLKAGGAFVPLAPSFPAERLRFMVEDAQVAVLLTQEDLVNVLHDICGTVICLDKDWESVASQQAEGDPLSEANAEHLAYVIYTSGSTGKPKGVQISHRALVNLMFSMIKEPGLTDQDVLLAVTTLSFDMAIPELFLPLIVGARIVIVSSEEARDGNRLLNRLSICGATFMQATPASWRLLLAVGWQGDERLKILCGGEALPRDLATQLLERSHSLWNMYGPTETTVWSAVNKLEEKEGPVSVGRPIANTQIYILDRHLQMVPVGVPGELHIGGDGLSRGYLNRPALTAERFIANPFDDKSGSRLYKTGDLAKYLPDGNVEVLGRLDFQVKVRGFRIELGEIEAVLTQHPAVAESVALVREDETGDKRLVAYVVVDAEQAQALTHSEGEAWTEQMVKTLIPELQTYLGEQLPGYMIPSAFVTLDSLPHTPTGKVDRQVLPAPDRNRSQPAEAFVAPRDELELQLTQIWEKVLGVKNIGMEDNFFDLGGHSLLAVRLFARIQKKFGQHLTLATLFQAPTIGQLARIIRQEEFTTPWSSLVPIQDGGSKPPFFSVHGCFGSATHFYDLARLLGPEQPFYGLRALGLEKGQVPQTRFEDMAAHYIKEIRTIQSDGPYFIGGSGVGCAIALEMAHQLESQGQNVALLFLMIPSYPKPNRSPKTFSKYYSLAKTYFSFAIIVIKSRLLLATVKHFFLNRVLWHLRICRRFIPDEIHRFHRFVDDLHKAQASYQPEAYQGRITCVVHEVHFRNHKKVIDDWRDLAVGGLDFGLMPGDTFTMWQEPHVQILADQLKVSLDEALTGSKGFIDTKN